MSVQNSLVISPVDYDPVKVGEALRRIRNHKDISLLELSTRTGIPQSKLSYIENGKYKKVKIEDIRVIAEALDSGLKELLNPSTERDAPDDGRIEREIETIRSYLLLGRYIEVAEMIRILETDISPGNKYFPFLLKAKGDYSRLNGDKKNALRQYDKLEAQAPSSYEKVSNKTMLEAIVASICTLYEMGEVASAIDKSIKVIDLLNKSENEPPHFNRYKAIIYYNLAIFYTASLQFYLAKNMAEKAIEYSNTDGIGLESHINYLRAIVLFYRMDWSGSEQCLYEAIKDFRLKNNTRLLTKALLAQHAFILSRPREYHGTLRALENIILQGTEPCGETCKRNPLYHQILNSTIEKNILDLNLDRANQLLDAMYRLGHSNSKTRYLQAKYFEARNNHEQVVSALKKATEEIEFDQETSNYEKGMIALEYLNHTVSGKEKDLISLTQRNFQQSELPQMPFILNDLLPSPID
ncbi:helix-turn-helix domain-containing protein [Paenibacillus alginolyticus]|uniref:helix-turn-helix domain-containing protein n=1 Tax=Paenibacillus alginolyticus TaxID=59839 RepID=UPI00040DAB23|nr:helix-turn-helix transcriptional regulator [Paenibacillus alginolyticus]MCY9666442.1 helix-turn-helix domain-containing protein [Paenibacillus alginolyticus]